MLNCRDFNVFELEWKGEPFEIRDLAVSEYYRTTSKKDFFTMVTMKDITLFLQCEYGISVTPVSDLQWNAECCHWGNGVGYNPIEAILTCFIDYAKLVKDGGDK